MKRRPESMYDVWQLAMQRVLNCSLVDSVTGRLPVKSVALGNVCLLRLVELPGYLH
jgi:hypothetical protein